MVLRNKVNQTFATTINNIYKGDLSVKVFNYLYWIINYICTSSSILFYPFFSVRSCGEFNSIDRRSLIISLDSTICFVEFRWFICIDVIIACRCCFFFFIFNWFVALLIYSQHLLLVLFI